MGNRCFLYAHAGNDRDAHVLLAEGNNHVPTLWHVLLAQAQPAPAITDQRLITPDADPGIEAPAAAALQRWHEAVAALKAHPDVFDQPELQRYLDATTVFLQGVLEPLGGDARLSADLSEIFLLGDDVDPHAAAAQWQAVFDDSWDLVREAQRGNGAFHLDAWLGFRPSGASADVRRRDAAAVPIADWSSWLWHFGFGGLAHAYFQHGDDVVRTQTFAAFVPPSDADDEGDEDPWRWSEWQEVPVDGGIALQRRPAQAVTDSATDSVTDSDNETDNEADNGPAGHEVHTPLRAPGVWDACLPTAVDAAWVQRGGLWGLMALDDVPRLLLPPQLEEIGEASGDEVVVRVDGRWGLLSLNGHWTIPPRYDGLWPPSEGVCVCRMGDCFGYVDRRGQEVVAPHFDDACDMERGFALVARSAEVADAASTATHLDAEAGAVGEMDEAASHDDARPLRWGMVDRHGVLRQPCIWDDIDPVAEAGWTATRDGRCAWLSSRGELLLPAHWEAIEPIWGDSLLRVRDGACWGAWAAAPGSVEAPAPARALLPCRYRTLDLLAWIDTPSSDPPRTPRTSPETADPLDDPLGASEVAPATASWWYALHDVPSPCAELAAASPPERLLRGLLLGVEDVEGRWGVVDANGMVRVALAYAAIEPLRTSDDTAARWLCAELPSGRGQVLIDLWSGRTVLDADDEGFGFDAVWPLSTQDGPEFWITARRRTVGSSDVALHVWKADGRPALNGALSWLDTPDEPWHGWTAQVLVRRVLRAWSRGEPVRAARMAEDGTPSPEHVWVRPGADDIVHADRLERLWQEGDDDAALALVDAFARGDGVKPDHAVARRWAARACGDDPASSRPLASPSAEAMRVYALQWMDGIGGEIDLRVARAWAERAAQAALDREEASQDDLPPAIANLLGSLLLNGDAGPPDDERAWQMFSRAAKAGDAAALLNQGVCLRDGRGVAPNLRQAIEAFTAAEAAGETGASLHLSLSLQALLADPDERHTSAEAARIARRIVYFADKALSHGEAGWRARLQGIKGWALLRLARGEAASSADGGAAVSVAVTTLEAAADGDDALAAHTLADEVYGHSDSPLHDAAQAAHWHQRAQALDRDAGGGTDGTRLAWWFKWLLLPLLLPVLVVMAIWRLLRRR